jgi:hypothetical protein
VIICVCVPACAMLHLVGYILEHIMHGPINVKSLNNTNKWQMGFNSAFKGLIMKQMFGLIKTIRNVSLSIHVLLVSKTRIIKYCRRLLGHTCAVCCTMCSFAFNIIYHSDTIHIVHSLSSAHYHNSYCLSSYWCFCLSPLKFIGSSGKAIQTQRKYLTIVWIGSESAVVTACSGRFDTG